MKNDSESIIWNSFKKDFHKRAFTKKQALVSEKVVEIKAYIKNNRNDFGQNVDTIEILLDSVLSGFTEENKAEFKLVK